MGQNSFVLTMHELSNVRKKIMALVCCLEPKYKSQLLADYVLACMINESPINHWYKQNKKNHSLKLLLIHISWKDLNKTILWRW